MEYWKSFRYKNVTYLILSIFFALLLSRYEAFHSFLLNIGNLGYIGAFLAGALFVSTFTVSIGILILFILAEKLSPLEIGAIAGLGAVLGDFTIFRFVKDNLLEEITPIYNRLGGTHITAVLHTKYFSWTLPLVGAIIIASPFPDEIGVSLMGIAKMKMYQFLLISFVLNSIGIFLVVSVGSIIKP